MKSSQSSLKKYALISLGVHVLIFVLIGSPLFHFGKPAFKREKVVWVNIPKGLGDKIGIGLKKSQGLPQSTIADSKKPLASSPDAPEKPDKKKKPEKPDPKIKPDAKAKPNTKPDLKQPQVGTKKIDKKPKPPAPKPAYKSAAEQALERIKASATNRETTTKVPEAAQLPKDMEEGGVPFGSDKGPFVMPDDPIYVLYQAKIRQKIMEAWLLPISFTNQNSGLTCVIGVKINQDGKVISAEFEQRSGNDTFDQSAFRAIFQASPLDVPPEKLKQEAVAEGFLIEFDPKAKAQ